MGTRSDVVVLDNNENVLCHLYIQYDGYFSGVGMELYDYLNNMDTGNVIPAPNHPTKFAFGMECLAAQLISTLKTCAGNVYLCVPYSKVENNIEQEYSYIIYLKENELYMKAYSCGELKFDDKLNNFKEFADNYYNEY